MKRFIFLLASILALFQFNAHSQVGDFKNAISFLASEDLEGRYPGSKADSIVREWLISQFRLYGLTQFPSPIDSFEQRFDIVEFRWFDATMELRSAGSARQFEYGKDFGVMAKSAVDTVSLEYLFIGHYLHDSLHCHIKDKAVFFYHYPPEKSDTKRTSLDDLSRAGARAAISVLKPDNRVSTRPSKGRLRKTYDMLLLSLENSQLYSFFDESQIREYNDSDKNNSKPYFGCPDNRILIATRRYHNIIESGNVLGLKQGRNDKYIIIGAHHDHLGRDPETGAIRPGANDNASGIAMLLGIAKRFGSIDTDNNILFIAFGGEEKGCLGSTHFVENLPFPKDDVIEMINLDIIGNMKHDTLYFKQFNNPDKILASGTRFGELNLKEHDPGLSDNFSFFQAGIPASFFNTGFDRDIIHTPDDKEEYINYEGMAKTLGFLIEYIRHVDANAD